MSHTEAPSIRAVDPHFALGETLYRRIKSAYCHLQPSDEVEIDVTAVNIPTFSVNRGKYCQRPEDVLRTESATDPRDWKIGEFFVHELPQFTENGQHWEFKPIDDPTEDNPAHAEVQTYLDGEKIERKNSAVRKLRSKLFEVMRIL